MCSGMPPRAFVAAVRGPDVNRLFMTIWPQRPLNIREPDLIAASGARRVDGKEYFTAMPGPLRDLSRQKASVEPQVDATGAQITRAAVPAVGRPGTGPERTDGPAAARSGMTRAGPARNQC